MRLLEEDPTPHTVFADVDSDLPYAAYVQTLYDVNVTVGCTADPLNYCPDRLTTKGEMAAFTTRAFGLEDTVPMQRFPDLPVDNVFTDNISALINAGVTEPGCSDGATFFCVDAAIAAQQAVEWLYKASQLPSGGDDATNGGRVPSGGNNGGGNNGGGRVPSGGNNGGGNNGGGRVPSGGNNGGQDNGGQDNGGQDNGGQDNGGQDNGGQDNGGQDNGGQDNGGQDNGGQDNGGQDNGGQDNGGQDNGGQDNGGQDNGGQDNGGQDNGGQDNGGQDNGGQDNGGQDNGGQDNGGQDNGGQDNGGQDNGGQDNGGQDNGGQDNGGQDNGGVGPGNTGAGSPAAGGPRSSVDLGPKGECTHHDAHYGASNRQSWAIVEGIYYTHWHDQSGWPSEAVRWVYWPESDGQPQNMSSLTQQGNLILIVEAPCTHIAASHDADHGADGTGSSTLVFNDITSEHWHEDTQDGEAIVWTRSDGENDPGRFLVSHVCTHTESDHDPDYEVVVRIDGANFVTYTHNHGDSPDHNGRSARWSRSPSGQLLHPPCFHQPY